MYALLFLHCAVIFKVLRRMGFHYDELKEACSLCWIDELLQLCVYYQGSDRYFTEIRIREYYFMLILHHVISNKCRFVFTWRALKVSGNSSKRFLVVILAINALAFFVYLPFITVSFLYLYFPYPSSSRSAPRPLIPGLPAFPLVLPWRPLQWCQNTYLRYNCIRTKLWNINIFFIIVLTNHKTSKLCR